MSKLRFALPAFVLVTCFGQERPSTRILQPWGGPKGFSDHYIQSVDAYFGAERAYRDDPSLIEIATLDLRAPLDRDPACPGPLHVLLHFKGYIALQAYRISHRLWESGRTEFARELHGRITQTLHVSIHPSVTIGSALFIDHGTGITIGEGVVIGEDVSMLQEVTLSSSPEDQAGAPRIGRGVLLSAGATVLGNVDIGDFAKIGAGSLVLASVPSGYTAVGVPARLVGRASDAWPALNMDQSLP